MDSNNKAIYPCNSCTHRMVCTYAQSMADFCSSINSVHKGSIGEKNSEIVKCVSITCKHHNAYGASIKND